MRPDRSPSSSSVHQIWKRTGPALRAGNAFGSTAESVALAECLFLGLYSRSTEIQVDSMSILFGLQVSQAKP